MQRNNYRQYHHKYFKLNAYINEVYLKSMSKKYMYNNTCHLIPPLLPYKRGLTSQQQVQKITFQTFLCNNSGLTLAITYKYSGIKLKNHPIHTDTPLSIRFENAHKTEINPHLFYLHFYKLKIFNLPPSNPYLHETPTVWKISEAYLSHKIQYNPGMSSVSNIFMQ